MRQSASAPPPGLILNHTEKFDKSLQLSFGRRLQERLCLVLVLSSRSPLPVDGWPLRLQGSRKTTQGYQRQ